MRAQHRFCEVRNVTKTDLVGDLDGFGLLGCLRRLKAVLEASHNIPLKRCGRSDNDLEFTLVFADELLEGLNDAVCFSEAAVCGQNGEEVLGDVREWRFLRSGALCGREETPQARRTVVCGDCRVCYECSKVRSVLDCGGNSLEFVGDFCERLGRVFERRSICGVGIF